MKRHKVITIVGTRPEIIRLSLVLKALDDCPSINHISVHTGQNYDYELNSIFYDDLKIRKPNYFLEAARETAIGTIGQIIINIEPILKTEKPDSILVLGDTNSCLCAIPAKKMKIPIFHMEAGNRCFDLRVPEEINRKIVDHISDINLTYSSIAREYLLKEGIDADKIIKTGSPMYEVLNYYKPQIKNSQILSKLNLIKNNYFLVSAHREENVSNRENLVKLLFSLEEITKKYNKKIIVSTHPRTRKELDNLKNNKDTKALIKSIENNLLIEWIKPLGFFDYNYLQMNSLAVLSDSGTINEESSILGFKALNIRENHERPEAMEEATTILTGLNFKNIENSIEHLIYNEQNNVEIVQDYSISNVSEKIVRLIISYTHYINNYTWRKKN